MTDHSVGLDPVGAPQRGQRQLDAHQYRLDLLDGGQLPTIGEDFVERKAYFCNEIRFQCSDGFGECGFVGEQLPAHPRPLRALARVDEHDARPAGALVGADHAGRGFPRRQRA